MRMEKSTEIVLVGELYAEDMGKSAIACRMGCNGEEQQALMQHCLLSEQMRDSSVPTISMYDSIVLQIVAQNF